MALLSADQLDELLRERHTKEEWIYLFRGVNQAHESEGNSKRIPESVLDAVTPGRKRKERYEDLTGSTGVLFTPQKAVGGLLDSEDGEIVILPSEDSSDYSPTAKMDMMRDQWDQVVGGLNKVSQNMAKFKTLCGKEVGAVEERLLQLDARVGLPPPGQRFEDCGSVWDGLAMVENNAQEIKLAIEDARFKSDAAVDALDVRLTQTFRDEKATSERVFNTAIVETQAAIKEIAEVVHILAQEQERLTTNALQSSSSATVDSRALAELNALKVQIKLMEARMPSVLAGRLGGQLFQSRTDVLLFVENHVPSNSFFLFHDVVTLMESLMTSHVERRDVLQEWYQSAKVGVNEASARHMASFRLVLPTVFGRTKEGAPPISVKHMLPAVKSFKDWNTYDGVSGTKGYIASGMEDLKYQFRQDIDQSFDPVTQSKARLLASEMHELSQNFVMEMCSWMDSFFQELVTTSEATEEEAWEVVSACIKKMFEVIRVPRAQAANATMDVNPQSQCATYLWALTQSHKIMREFIEARFRNHGAIAPVIVLHIFKTRVTRVAMTTNIKRLEGRISALEKVKDRDKK